jgi:hypothetical protein
VRGARVDKRREKGEERTEQPFHAKVAFCSLKFPTLLTADRENIFTIVSTLDVEDLISLLSNDEGMLDRSGTRIE